MANATMEISSHPASIVSLDASNKEAIDLSSQEMRNQIGRNQYIVALGFFVKFSIGFTQFFVVLFHVCCCRFKLNHTTAALTCSEARVRQSSRASLMNLVQVWMRSFVLVLVELSRLFQLRVFVDRPV